jgi:hypothetical protein
MDETKAMDWVKLEWSTRCAAVRTSVASLAAGA